MAQKWLSKFFDGCWTVISLLMLGYLGMVGLVLCLWALRGCGLDPTVHP